MYISVTQIHLKNLWKFPLFMKHNIRIFQQLKDSEGHLQVKTKADSPYSFYTLTSWNRREDMLQFMRSGAHGEAMREMAKVSDWAKSYGYESAYFPEWKEALEKMNRGKFSQYA